MHKLTPVQIGNIDETSAADQKSAERMKQRGLAGQLTNVGCEPMIPAAEFAKHLSLLIGVGCKLVTRAGHEHIESMGSFPSLSVHTGKEAASMPELNSDCLPNAHHVMHESGSVTLDIFEEYLMKVILPFLKRQFPDLRKDVQEFILVYDIPSVHNVSDKVLTAFLEAGVIIYGLPPNSTHWSQPCDNRAVFGAFKRGTTT